MIASADCLPGTASKPGESAGQFMVLLGGLNPEKYNNRGRALPNEKHKQISQV
ncbi:uncharacterized protein G6M90_00g036800 [Metarhizium brunneum]|uniref:Uncharacterized protein n=1 Tax=Metarhizium brunneum TaxID=500148 RepID=A0A7D5YZD4_9HYPO|nr:hypothetical protein G6M90_00g036800 [Metarhizium brunneum]